ncbi:hypothetical protein ACRRTK_024086 [Alexandromys fortis]
MGDPEGGVWGKLLGAEVGVCQVLQGQDDPASRRRSSVEVSALACSCAFLPRLTRAPPRGPRPSGSSFPEGSEFSGDWWAVSSHGETNGADKLPHTGNNNSKQEKGSHPDEFNPEEKIENRSLTGYAFRDSRTHPGCPPWLPQHCPWEVVRRPNHCAPAEEND